MTSYLRNAVSRLYDLVSTPVAATRDALADRLQRVRESASLLYNRFKERVGYGQTLQDTVEEKAERDHVEEPQEDDDGIEQMEDGDRVKTWRALKNLNRPLTDVIMREITPHISMRTKVVCSFKCYIYRGTDEIIKYEKLLPTRPGLFTSLSEIQGYIEECEQKQLDLDNEEVWSKAYLPEERTTDVKDNYEGKVVFDHVQVKLISSNEPLIGCGLLPE